MIHDILILQKRELEKKLKEQYVERDAKINALKSDMIKVIIGPRRAGKSFFSIHALRGIVNFGYVNFDDEKLVEVKDYNEIINGLDSVYDNPKFLLLDEIQNLPKWELFVNRLQRQGRYLVVTGSNSNLLSGELATHLTGRYLPTALFTFSFNEFLKFKGRNKLTDAETRKELGIYLTSGGYPEPLVKNLDYKEYLTTLFNSIIYKDIVKRYKIRSVGAIEDLAAYLISNVAKEYSYNTLTDVTRCKSVHTVAKYIKYLEETFILFKLDRFSFKLKEQTKSSKKIYCYDNGFIYAKAFKLSPDTGRLYENIVAVHLKKSEDAGGARIFYWKNQQGEEVDFVVRNGIVITELLQVCYDINEPDTKQREIKALLKAGKELKCKKLVIITSDYEAKEKAEWFGIKEKILFVPLWKWLLEK